MSLCSELSVSQAAQALPCTHSLRQVDAFLLSKFLHCLLGGFIDPSLQPVGQCLPVVRSLLVKAVEFIIHSSKGPPGLL